MAKQVVTCPKCSGKMAAPEGKERFRCPKCKTVLSAPKESGVAVESETATMTFAVPEPPTTAPAGPVTPPAKPDTKSIVLDEKALAPPGGELAAGERLGGYTITRLIGHGSLGAVYEAVQEGLKRRVAIKVLPATLARDAAFLARFKREAQAVAKLNHPSIVQIFDVDEAQGRHFFSMEYVDGESLADRLVRETRLRVGEAVPIIAQVAMALDHAHERLIIHRDIKPANILLTERGDVKVADIGLSRSLEGTEAGIVRGARGGPLYMAPEFAQNPRLADCRSDIYALGCVLYHLLTGQPPFPGPSVAEMIVQHADAPFPAASALFSDVPLGVDSLLQKMCAKDPAERFQSYEELLGRMQSLSKGTAIRLPAVRRGEEAAPAEEAADRKGWVPLAVGAAAVALALLIFFTLLLPRLLGSRGQATIPTTATSPKADTRRKPGPTIVPPAKKGKEGVESPKAKPPIEEPKEKEPKEKEPAPPVKVEEPEAKEKEPGPKEAEPKKGEGDDWQAKLEAATKSADELAAQGEFGKAIAAIEGVAKGNDDAKLREAVDTAKAAVQQQAAKAFEGVVKSVRDLAGRGKLDEAKAALQKVVETYGTDAEVVQARAGVEAIDQFRESRSALAKGAEEARAAATAATARAAKQAEAAKALSEAQALLADWKLEEAIEALGKLKYEDAALAAQVEQRKAAVEALAAYRDAVCAHLKAAEPPLRKIELRVTGLNGELTGGDKEGLSASLAGGAKEKIPWSKLGEATLDRLSKLKGLAKPSDAAQQLAIGLWLRLAGNEQKAGAAFRRAEDAGAKIDALGDPAQAAEKADKEAKAASALAETLKLFLDGKQREGEAALTDYREKFAATAFFGANEKVVEVASAYKPYSPPGAAQPEKEPPPKQTEPEPKPKEPQPKTKQPQPKQAGPADEKKAKECYEKAVAAYEARDLEACGKQLDALREASAASPLLTDKNLNPTVEAMEAAVKARGQTLKVATGGRGTHASLDKAIEAIEKTPATIEVMGGPHSRIVATISPGKGNGLILRGVGERKALLHGGTKADTLLTFGNNVKNVWIGNLEFSNTKTALDAAMGCEITIHNCTALTSVENAISSHVQAKVSVEGSVLRLTKLGGLTARNSAFLLPDGATVEGGNVAACVIVGKDIQFRNVTLTDCLILGDGDLHGGVKLSHVTTAGSLTLSDDARGAAIADSIIASLVPPEAKAKAKDAKKAELAATLTDVALYAQTRALPRDLVKTENLSRLTRPPFENPYGPRYWLPDNSPLRGKASDKGDLGCRFPQDMRAIWHSLGARAADLLKPPPTKRR